MSEALSIVGAGRVGKALGRCLHDLGWRIGVVTTQSIPTARTAVRAIGAGHPADQLTSGVLASKVVLIATPDRVIADVARDLAQLGGNEWLGNGVLHTTRAPGTSPLRALSGPGRENRSVPPSSN